MKREFTASVYLLDNQKVFLSFHRKLQKWLPPGGHVEQNETPSEAAQREVKEETGFDISFICQENIHINYWNAKSIARPYLCLLEEIPAYREIPAHQHIDLVYIAKVIGGNLNCCDPFQWFTWKDLLHLSPDKDIFQETLDIIQHLLSATEYNHENFI
jgi:8-oxo-dGTP pyrophosphatase MutT (NUDIX family)